jgi:hypothetical protein
MPHNGSSSFVVRVTTYSTPDEAGNVAEGFYLLRRAIESSAPHTPLTYFKLLTAALNVDG